MTAVEGEPDVVVGLDAPVEPELGVYVAEMDGIAVDTVVVGLPSVPG